MVNLALRATTHVAAWFVWHATHVSLLDDLDAPAPRSGLAGGLGPGSRVPWHSYSGSAMPLYEYRCEDGHTFEVMQRMSDDPVQVCEVCGKPVQRVFHPVAVHFKGSGFYNTDY